MAKAAGFAPSTTHRDCQESCVRDHSDADDRLNRAHFEVFDEGAGVITLVAEEGLGLHFSRECFGLGDVVDLAAGEAERQRIAQGVDDHMDLGGRAAARAAYGLVEPPSHGVCPVKLDHFCIVHAPRLDPKREPVSSMQP